VYFTTYKGKYYRDPDGVSCYNAVDAERTDIVNDGIYNRVAYTGHLYAPANEVGVPWAGSTNSGACDATTGASWNQNVVPFLNATTFGSGNKPITTAQKTLMTTARLEKASFGGVDATGSLAPLGCALKNDAVADRYHSAADYMSAVQSTDATNNSGKPPCWTNNIVLVVDGQSNGPGDTGGTTDCASAACAYNATTNPSLVGCTCAAITKAYGLAHSGTPIQTHVVVNAPATWSARYPYSYAFLWNLAVAGSPNFDGTPSFGTTEDEVYKGISDKIAAAAYHFPYTTTAAVAGSTTQDTTTKILTPSNFLYDTSVSYPSWKGNLRAFDMTSSVDLKWDAVTVAANNHPADWTQRRIFFSDKSGNAVQVQISSAGAISNASALHTAGLGATDAEAGSIMQWLLGKPELGNPTPLMGSITSSTPIAVGQGGDINNSLNGSFAYAQKTQNRPQLVYVGADDGMLHAFFGHVGSKTLAGQTYEGGEEAFAFIPNDMLAVITKLYLQGGQKLSVDKSDHVFGLAGSPKVKDMCFGTSCANSDGSDWHTVLVMTEGPGGNKPFALDITNVVDASNGLIPSNMNLLWNPGVRKATGAWNTSLGETTSVPAFYHIPTGTTANNRVVFASGYPVDPSSTSQGLTILDADVFDGTVEYSKSVATLGISTCNSPSGRKRAVLADITMARDYSTVANSQNIKAAYVGDTFGNTFQYVPTASNPVTNLYSLGCGQPLYFAPAVVQLDRVPKAGSSATNFIYLAQVTNSNLDPDSIAVSSDYPPSQLVVTKLDGNVSPPTIVTSYNPLNSSGQVILTLDPAASASNRICIQTVDSGTGTLNGFTDNTKKMTQSCADAGAVPLPSTARPVGTPTVVLRSDGLGFQAITSWYDPTAMANDCSTGNQFNYGKSYITVHEFGADGTWYQIAGVTLSNTVLTGVTFVGAGLFVDGVNAASAPQSINIGETFSSMQQLLNNSAPDRYSRTSWSERVDL
jgi:hypothetical protein